MAYTPPSEEQIKEALEIIWDAPQSSFFTKERVTTFVQSVIEAEESLLFHAKRLHSIGPSEAGFLVTSFRNHTRKPGQPFESSFRSAFDVYREKHLISLPESKPELQRGTRAESTIRQLYIEQLRAEGYTVEIPAAEMKALSEWRDSGATLDKKHPWLRSINVDDLLKIDGKLTLVDYKATSDAMLEKLKVDIGTPYKVQLHLYNHGLSCIGIAVDEMKLVPFNYAEWKAEEIEVPFSPDLLEQTFDACNFYYDLIVSGKRPPIIKPTEEVFDPSKITEEVKDLASEIGMLGSIEDAARDLRQAKNEQLKAHFNRYEVSGQVNAILGPVNVTMKEVVTYDEEGLLLAAEELGVAVEKGVKGKKLAKLIEQETKLANRHDINVDNYIDLKRTTTPRAATGNSPGAHLRNVLKVNATELVQGLSTSAALQLREVHDLIDEDADKQEFFARHAQQMFKQLYDEYVDRQNTDTHNADVVEALALSLESDEDLVTKELDTHSINGMSEDQADEIKKTGGFTI